MPQYLTGEELAKRWDIEEFDLYYIVRRENLVPYDDTGRPVLHPDRQAQLDYLESWEDELGKLRRGSMLQHSAQQITRRKKELMQRISEFKRTHRHYGELGWSLFPVPERRDELRKLMAIVTKCIFLIDQVERFEQDEEFVHRYGIRLPEGSALGERKRKESKADELDTEKASLVHEIGEEAERIYKHIVKEVGVTDKHLKSRSERRDCALNLFRENQGSFNRLKEEHLFDLAIYDFGSSQSKRNYMTRILKAVYEDLFPNQRHAGYKLYDQYKSTCRPKPTNTID